MHTDNPSIFSVMTKFPFVVDPDTTLAEAQDYMEKIDCRHLPVMKEDEVIGLLSERELKQALAFELGEKLIVRDVMNTKPVTIKVGTSLSQVAKLMAETKVGSVVILNDKDQLMGIFTTTDGMRLLASILEEDAELDHLREKSIEEFMSQNFMKVV